MKFFDSHCHLEDERFDEDREELISKIKEDQIEKVTTVGYSVKSSKNAIELATQYEFIYATVGISPNDIEKEVIIQKEILKIETLIAHKKVVAIGEIGLDYYWNKENKEQQQQFFIKQIELANQYQLPIVIHNREAVDDTLGILRKYPVIKKGIFHCCPFNLELVRQGLELGFYISFAGPTTFKNSKNADQIINLVPMDRLLIETDSPYLSPEPKRGKRNDPRNVKYIAQKIANVKGVSLEEIANRTYENACKIFGIK